MRIVLDNMPEDSDPILSGSQGTVVGYDDAGDLMVDWDKDVGRSLHLIPGVDEFHVLDSDNPAELERSWKNLAAIQRRLRDGKNSRCPRCGKVFDCHRGAVSRRVSSINISICDTCGQQEAIEDFVANSKQYGLDAEVYVPVGRNQTGFESEEAGEREKIKIAVLPLNDWYIVKIWDGRYQGKDMDQEEAV